MNKSNIKIAYLVLAHTDPKHIARLSNALKTSGDVFIHVDLKSDIESYIKSLGQQENSIRFIKDRYKVYWAGFNSVKATIALIKAALNNNRYERFVILQGLDYPIWSDDKIMEFFNMYSKTEFIRACNVSVSNDPYFNVKVKKIYYNDLQNRYIRAFLREVIFRIPFIKRDKQVFLLNQKRDVFYGSALWAITNNCAQYILHVYEHEHEFNKYMKNMFAPDESYFHTIVHNSRFRKNTLYGGPEPQQRGLVNWANLHNFVYDDNGTKVFKLEDFDLNINSGAAFFRKVKTGLSDELLDKIDASRASNLSYSPMERTKGILTLN